MATYLDRILASHRAAAAGDRRDLARLESDAAACGPTRGFAAAIRSSEALAVIAEVKRASPSRGSLDLALDPARLAAEYQAGGASALSVLTDAAFFRGSPEDLRAARAATSLPVLRKDFTVSEADVFDARCMGADAVLLIVAALSADQLRELLAAATRVGLDALVEVHDEREACRAVDAGARLIGVNQRDLTTFEVDTDRAVRLAGLLPATVTKVAESGIRGRADARHLADAGFDAVLVGESLVVAADPADAVRDLRVSRSARSAG